MTKRMANIRLSRLNGRIDRAFTVATLSFERALRLRRKHSPKACAATATFLKLKDEYDGACALYDEALQVYRSLA